MFLFILFFFGISEAFKVNLPAPRFYFHRNKWIFDTSKIEYYNVSEAEFYDFNEEYNFLMKDEKCTNNNRFFFKTDYQCTQFRKNLEQYTLKKNELQRHCIKEYYCSLPNNYPYWNDLLDQYTQNGMIPIDLPDLNKKINAEGLFFSESRFPSCIQLINLLNQEINYIPFFSTIKYNTSMETENFKIPYFITSDFELPSLEFEQQLEARIYFILKKMCKNVEECGYKEDSLYCDFFDKFFKFTTNYA